MNRPSGLLLLDPPRDAKLRFFHGEVLDACVRIYLQHGAEYSSARAQLALRGVHVSAASIESWMHTQGASPGAFTDHLPEPPLAMEAVYVKLNRRWCYLYRALNRHALLVDFYVTRMPDQESARHFFEQMCGFQFALIR